MVTVMTEVGRGGQKRRSCNGTCHNARKPKCVCICGGRYHGAARDSTLQQKLEADLKPSVEALEKGILTPNQIPLPL